MEALYLGEEFNRFCLLRALINPVFVLLVQVVLEELRIDVKLYSVVASRDCFHVPFDIIVLLRLLDVVNIVDHEKSDEYCTASDDQALLLSPDQDIMIDRAGELDENLRFAGGALLRIET